MRSTTPVYFFKNSATTEIYTDTLFPYTALFRSRRKIKKPVKAQLGVLSRLIASQPKAPNPTGYSRVLTPENPETKPIIESIVRQTDAKIAAQDAILDQLETHDPTRFDVEEQQIGRAHV